MISIDQFYLTLFWQLFRRVAAALPGMEANEKSKEDSTYSCLNFLSKNCFVQVLYKNEFFRIY